MLALDAAGEQSPECEGTLAEAEAAGLFHPNCLHSVTVYVPGLTEKVGGKDRQGYTPEMDREGYENRQRQRYTERMVRQWKRRQAVATTPEGERKAKAYVDRWQRKLRELTGETGLPRQYRREGGRVKLSEAAKRLGPVRLDDGITAIATTVSRPNEFLRYNHLEDIDKEIESLRAQQQALFEQDDHDKAETDALLEKIKRLFDMREIWSNANKLAAGDKEIMRNLLSNDPVRVMKGIEKAIGGDRFGLPESRWSGKAEVKTKNEMPRKALGTARDPSRDIWLREDCLHVFSVAIHEDLHMRSIHRYDSESDRQWVRNNIRGFEEGVVQLRTETMCKKLGMTYIKTYSKYADALRTLHKLLEPDKSEYGFAKDLFDKDPISRYNSFVDSVQKLRDQHPRKWKRIGKDVEAALATLKERDP